MRQRSQCSRLPASGSIELRCGSWGSPGGRLDGAAWRRWELAGPRAVVEAAGEVFEHLAVEPVAVAAGDLPAQRRILRVHAGAAGHRGLHVDLHDQLPDVFLEAEVQRVADLRRAAERQLVGALRLGGAVRDADVGELA